MDQYDTDANQLEEGFQQNQEGDKMKFEQELEESIQGKVRPSPKLLNMKYRMEQLSKYQRFEEAAKLQGQYEIEVNFI